MSRARLNVGIASQADEPEVVISGTSSIEINGEFLFLSNGQNLLPAISAQNRSQLPGC
jgi:hypothetical protein